MAIFDCLHFFDSDFTYFFLFQTVRLIERTDADVKIFAGDVNALPFPGLINGKRQPYSLLTSIMTDSLVDRYPDASWHPWFATFGNHHNTYSASDAPERIDYLMYWAAPHIAMCTRNFTMPMYTTKNRKGELVSLSDHEALDAEFLIERRSTPYNYKNTRRNSQNLEKYDISPSTYSVPKSSRSKNKDLEHTAPGQKLINNPNYSNKRHDFSDFIRYSRLIRNSNSKEFYENSELYQKRQDKSQNQTNLRRIVQRS